MLINTSTMGNPILGRPGYIETYLVESIRDGLPRFSFLLGHHREKYLAFYKPGNYKQWHIEPSRKVEICL